MKKNERIVGGILLVSGSAVLFGQIRPDLIENWFGARFSWSVFFSVAGLLFLISAVLRRAWGLALIAASTSAAGVLQILPPPGGAFLPSWEILWPLLPAVVGLGLLLGSFFSPQKAGRSAGLPLLFISLLAIIIFFSMANANLNMHLTWAALLILSGFYFLTRGFSQGE